VKSTKDKLEKEYGIDVSEVTESKMLEDILSKNNIWQMKVVYLKKEIDRLKETHQDKSMLTLQKSVEKEAEEMQDTEEIAKGKC